MLGKSLKKFSVKEISLLSLKSVARAERDQKKNHHTNHNFFPRLKIKDDGPLENLSLVTGVRLNEPKSGASRSRVAGRLRPLPVPPLPLTFSRESARTPTLLHRNLSIFPPKITEGSHFYST